MSYFKKKAKLLFVLCIGLFVGLAGCDSEITHTDSSSSENGNLEAVGGTSSALDRPALSEQEMKERLQEFAEKKGREGIKQKIKDISYDQSYFRKFLIEGVIDGDQYECSSTPLDTWVNNNVYYSSLEEALYVAFFGIDQFPYIYNLLYVNPREDRQAFGENGEYTRQVYRASRSVKRFWDVDLRDVQVESFRGAMLKDFDKVFKVVEVLWPSETEESNAAFAQDIVDVVQEPSNPVWSFNAFAMSEGPVIVGGEDKPAQIQMGDGIMEGMDALGFGDSAPQGILAHEMAHQVQFKLNVFENDTISDPAESTRRTELMADAYAAYYLAHKRGASMNWDRVESFMQTFYNIGDCSFSSSGHHGTPNQRLAAAQFGFDLAESADRRVGIMSASEFLEAFDDKLPELVAPDAEGS